MSVGRRIARLRISQGESLRAAAVRTGVSHTTIARIEKGDVTGSFHKTIERIALGYGVPVDYLLTGSSSGRVPPAPRLDSAEMALLLMAPGRERLIRAYRLLTGGRPTKLNPAEFAAALDSDTQSIERALSGESPIAPELEERLCDQLASLTGLSPTWFKPQREQSRVDMLSSEQISSYLKLVIKAHRAGVSPELLAVAVEMLLLRAEPKESLSREVQATT